MTRAALALMAAMTAAAATAQEPLTDPDGSGGPVVLPMGAVSFADATVRDDMGDPAPIPPSRVPEAAPTDASRSSPCRRPASARPPSG